MLVARGDRAQSDVDLPVVPDAVHESAVPGAPKGLTWKHVLLGAVHNTFTGGHRNAREMHDELVKLVSWWPPEALLKICEEWRSPCRLSSGVHKRPRHEAPYNDVRSDRPLHRMQIDLLEVRPTGTCGERYVLTCIFV